MNSSVSRILIPGLAMKHLHFLNKTKTLEINVFGRQIVGVRRNLQSHQLLNQLIRSTHLKNERPITRSHRIPQNSDFIGCDNSDQVSKSDTIEAFNAQICIYIVI